MTDLHEGERTYAARTLSVTTRAPGEAREWAAGTLARWGLPGAVDDVQVVISELVTNALQHGGTAVAALLEWHRVMDMVEVSVWDDAPGEPRPQDPGFEAERGRGLFLVEGLSAKWGHHAGRDGGKVTWAQPED